MNKIIKKHTVYFIEYIASILISYLAIKYFFHIPEIVEFGPIYISILIFVFFFWLYNFNRDMRELQNNSTMS